MAFVLSDYLSLGNAIVLKTPETSAMTLSKRATGKSDERRVIEMGAIRDRSTPILLPDPVDRN